ncbi:MAG: alkaline phosphatase family protein [Gemmatimonadaceae bacterium]|nr:alkaline phosphatase family protein [Gemmatimonadaceae bacterium]MBA3645888.1 alkaline phosphatase family protein [Gemmatimonadaceae bacterium]
MLFPGAVTLSAQSAGYQQAPSLVVVITVDQLRPDYYARYRSQLTGGLRRLYEGGAVFTDAYQDHANTETAPGHSAILSGRFPNHTGIVLNTVGVPDPQSPLIGGGGPPASPFRFRGSTLIDWMRTNDPRSRALSVSRKDRGAILPLGRAHQSVYWYASGRFTTSTYYADTLPDWVRSFNALRIPERSAGKSWTPLLPDSAYTEKDDVIYEGEGDPTTFPHVLSSDSARAALEYVEFPWMDSLTVQLALKGVRELGLGTSDLPDLLAISLSTTDAVGHRYGPDSKEMHDQILRVDKYLGTLLDSLYASRDSTQIVVALTADHGVAPYPEFHTELHPVPAGQYVPNVDLRPLIASFQTALAKTNINPAAFHLDEWALIVDRREFDGVLNADSVIDSFAAAARRLPGVLRADRPRDLFRADTLHDAVMRRWVHAIPQDSPIELVITLTPYTLLGPRGYAEHGTPYDYDAHVPMLFYGPQFARGQYHEFSRVVDMAPTLAYLLGIKPTELLDGHILMSAMRRPGNAGMR